MEVGLWKQILHTQMYMIHWEITQIHPYRAGIDFSRQILTSVDIDSEILTSRVDPRTVRVSILVMVADP